MRKNQTIFRAVIRAGYYGPDRAQKQAPYMCTALDIAHNAKCITSEECARARKAIMRYIRELTDDHQCPTMRLALHRGLGHDHALYTWEHGAGQDFYWNWAKRPRKTNNE